MVVHGGMLPLEKSGSEKGGEQQPHTPCERMMSHRSRQRRRQLMQTNLERIPLRLSLQCGLPRA